MSKIIYLSPPEAELAASLSKGDTMVIVRLIEQPPEGYKMCKDCPDGICFSKDSTHWTLDKLHPVGTLLDGKETWGSSMNYWGNVIYLYKATIGAWPRRLRWHSPVTMPQDVVRSRFKVVKNWVDKVSEDGKDGYIAGHDCLMDLYAEIFMVEVT